MNINEIKTIKLNDYRGHCFIANVEEDIDNIHLAILYHDHGDEFLFIETKNGERYEYGFWNFRKYEDDYNSLPPAPNKEYVRNPLLYCSPDTNSRLSNELYYLMERNMAKSHMSCGFDKKYHDADDAQWYFDCVLSGFKSAKDQKVMYDYSDNLKKIESFLELNGIKTEKNVSELKKYITSKIDGMDGVAAKRRCYDKILRGDGINFIFVDGKEFDVDNVAYSSSDYDDWGCRTHYLPLDQFSEDSLNVYKQRAKDLISEKIEKLTNTINNIDSYNIQKIYTIIDSLEYGDDYDD